MPEKTKPEANKEEQSEAEKTLPESAERDWSAKDQREKSYYYDDAHGYEIYKPDEDEEDD